MKKGRTIVIAWLAVICLLFTACGSASTEDVGKAATETALSAGTDSTEVSYDKSILTDLGEGINIGNSLDACNWDTGSNVCHLQYQIMSVYASDPWSKWDASEALYIKTDGTLDVSWNMDGLQSTSSAGCGSFSFQIINHDKAAQNKNFKVIVSNAKFTASNGNIYSLDALNGEHSMTMKGNVSGYVSQDITQMDGLDTTSDLYGGTLTYSVKLENYTTDSVAETASLEESWGNPQISKQLIDAIKAEGFKTVRIPVTYFNHMSSDGTIDSEFLDRVEQVVNYALSDGLYCIITIQHDTGNDGWIKASDDNYTQNSQKVAYMIRQIAQRFKDKNGHLILEGFNEIVDDNNRWNNIPGKNLEVMNKWNQLFVDTVRKTKGKNTKRYLIVNTYAASPSEECLKAFRMPEDSVKDRILVGVHCYFDEKATESGFKVLAPYATEYPLLIGEWGLSAKVSGISRTEYTRSFMGYARTYGIPTILWDDGSTSSYAYMNRTTNGWYEKETADLIVGN